MKSAFLRLNWTDVKKIMKGLGIAMAGGALAAGVEYISGIDLGQWQIPVMAGLSAMVNALLKLLSGGHSA